MNENTNGSFELCNCADECNCVAESQDFNEESPLNQTTIGYLLDEVLKKKKQLLDPRHRRNKFFPDIRDRLAERGLFFSAKTLEKKFHNLKKHFATLCQNRDRATVPPKKPITWPYFEKMMEIFAEELEIEDAPTMASLYPDVPLPKNAIFKEDQVHKEDNEEEEECVSENDLEQETEVDENGESTWSHKAVFAFLKECIRKKEDLWDPNVRRRKIFTEIRHQLKAKGFLFNQESLDRKLRNMKTHYQITTKAINSLDNTRRRRNTWPYYDQLHQIYGENIEVLRKKSGRDGVQAKKTKLSSTVSRPTFRAIKTTKVSPQVLEFIQSPQSIQLDPCDINSEETNNVDEPASIIDDNTAIKSCPPSPGDLDNQFQEGESTMDYSFNTESERPIDFEAFNDETPMNAEDDYTKFTEEILALEERRTVVAEQLLEEIKESNRIREKKLQFNRIKLEHLKARAKRKRSNY